MRLRAVPGPGEAGEHDRRPVRDVGDGGVEVGVDLLAHGGNVSAKAGNAPHPWAKIVIPSGAQRSRGISRDGLSLVGGEVLGEAPLLVVSVLVIWRLLTSKSPEPGQVTRWRGTMGSTIALSEGALSSVGAAVVAHGEPVEPPRRSSDRRGALTPMVRYGNIHAVNDITGTPLRRTGSLASAVMTQPRHTHRPDIVVSDSRPGRLKGMKMNAEVIRRLWTGMLSLFVRRWSSRGTWC